MKNIVYLIIAIIGFFLINSFIGLANKKNVVRYKVSTNIEKKIEGNGSKIDSLLQGSSKELAQKAKSILKLLTRDSKKEVFAVLNFNNNFSKFEAEEKLKANSFNLNLNLIAANQEGVVFSNKSTNQVIRSKEYEGINVRITSDFDKYTWVKSDSIQTILGYKCYYATTKSKNGHLVKAWYTKELEGSAGPEDYTGLDGIILELDINEGLTQYKAVEVKENKNYKFKTPKKGKLFTEEEFAEFVKKNK